MYRKRALQALKLKAESDKAEALTSLEILLEHPAGIGDHSTTDLHNNLNEGLAKLADAQDRLETLSKFFPEQGNDNFSTQ